MVEGHYSSVVGRWVVVTVVALACAFGAGCTDHARTAPAVGPDIPGVEFPALPAIDPRVMRVGSAVKSPWNGLPRSLPNGLRLKLDRCELRAPGQWLVDGHVVLPKGAHGVDATLGLGFGHGDVSQTAWVHNVTFSGSGRFAVTLPGEQVHGRGPRHPYDDAASHCEARIWSASVPTTTQGAFVAPTPARRPFVYEAPADSIQALGIGAPLGHRQDPRTISLYTVWAGTRSAITEVWVPVVAGARPALLSVRPSRPSCTAISVRSGPADGDDAKQVTVTTRMGCDAPSDDDQGIIETHDAVKGAPGFTWGRPAYPDTPDVARRTIGKYDVWVQGGAAVERDRVAHIAATLATRRNLATTGEPVPARPPTLDAAVAKYLDAHTGLTERARFRYRDGWMVFVEDNGSSWNYHLLRAGHVANGWWTDASEGGGGSQDRCFVGPSASNNANGDNFAYVIAGNPRWTIQGFVDGRWRTVDSTNGVLFEDGTVPDPPAFPGRARPIDATGKVPACFLAENPSG